MSGIVRINKTEKFFVASNQPFNDPELSWGARGIMGYLLSKPDGWQVRNKDLYRKSPDGKSKVDNYLVELKKAGYLRRYRKSEGKGSIIWISEVYESKEMNPDFSIPGNSTLEKSTDEISRVEKQPHIVNTDPVNTELVKTEGIDPLAHLVQAHSNGIDPNKVEPSEWDRIMGDKRRDEVTKVYETEFGIRLNPGQRFALGELSQKDHFEIACFTEFCRLYNRSGGYAYDLERVEREYSHYTSTGQLPTRTPKQRQKGPNIVGDSLIIGD